MPEYIKMTDAITTTWMILRGMGYAAEDNPDMVKTVAAVFDTAPAADVVEVVRCGDCIRKDICRTSNVWAVSPDDNWFCAGGERQDGGHDE